MQRTSRARDGPRNGSSVCQGLGISMGSRAQRREGEQYRVGKSAGFTWLLGRRNPKDSSKKLAARAFGIEGDPAAFAEVTSNVALNSNLPWAQRVLVQPAAVTTTEGPQHMTSSVAGNSCSSLVSNGCGKVHQRWQVMGYPLPRFFAVWNIVPSQRVFIKIDVEGYECLLLPNLATWLGSLGASKKPTLHFALHARQTTCSATQYQAIMDLGSTYAHAYCTSGRSEDVQWKVNATKPRGWKTPLACTNGEVVFSDMDV